MIITVKLRKAYNKQLLDQMELEIKAEEKMNDKEKELFNKGKQVQLENRIAAEISNKISDAQIIKNAYIPKSDGTYAEIDLILICKMGIYIIESKDITGTINGDWKSDHLSYTLTVKVIQCITQLIKTQCILKY